MSFPTSLILTGDDVYGYQRWTANGVKEGARGRGGTGRRGTSRGRPEAGGGGRGYR